MSPFWLGFFVGGPLMALVAWNLAIISVKFDRARRGWNRKT